MNFSQQDEKRPTGICDLRAGLLADPFGIRRGALGLCRFLRRHAGEPLPGLRARQLRGLRDRCSTIALDRIGRHVRRDHKAERTGRTARPLLLAADAPQA